MNLKDAARAQLPVILIAALLQGWSLYGLHWSIEHQKWPATDFGWLLALYAIAVFVPVAVQLLAADIRKGLAWWTCGALGAFYFYVGWFHGRFVVERDIKAFNGLELCVAPTFELLVLWLVLLPFIQCRLMSGKWVPSYQQLFSVTWRNKLTLAEAALFTGLFWALLGLWQQLFHLLGINYFRELFQEPIFIYPVTALAFGIALHLIGSLEKWTSVVLEQLLSVLKWLGVLAVIILAFFTVTLVFKLRGLVFFGEHAIGAAWLLWLVAVVVLFVNAAFRDGSDAAPYPKGIRTGVRAAMPLLVVVALTAGYALIVRQHEYGLTVARVWALIVAGLAVLYAGGYSWAAFRAEPWLAGVARVNVLAAGVLIAAVMAALTPILSPYRLAANSQFELAARWQSGEKALPPPAQTPFHYLRFGSGAYGIARLRELATSPTLKVSPEVRRRASEAVAQTNPWQPEALLDAEAILASLPLFPANQSIGPELRAFLLANLRQDARNFNAAVASPPIAGIFVDLDGDGSPEFVLVWKRDARAYAQQGRGWRVLGAFELEPAPDQDLLAHLATGDFAAIAPTWNDLRIGKQRYRYYLEPK